MNVKSRFLQQQFQIDARRSLCSNATYQKKGQQTQQMRTYRHNEGNNTTLVWKCIESTACGRRKRVWKFGKLTLVIYALVNTYILTLSLFRKEEVTRKTRIPVGRRGSYCASLHHVVIYNQSKSNFNTSTPNLYELMGSPSHCLNCTTNLICEKKAPKKFLKKQIWFEQPIMDPSQLNHYSRKLIPRIIHQSWYKNITRREHPNLSRIQNSWKINGWEYKYYDDEAAAAFIRAHFPPEILEAYDILLPGAFKADLFRYCVLFIEGGVWADIDMQLQTNLDHFIYPSDGFIVPRDMDGYGIHNALIMSAPGHPILLQAIEETTNMVRNRYTIIDIASRFCPDSVNENVFSDHMTLFLTGPGLLSYAIKKTLGYPLMLPFLPGLVRLDSSLVTVNKRVNSDVGQVRGVLSSGGILPGKTKILERIVEDLGETRYTDTGMNLIIAGTDIPEGNDKKDSGEHYSKTHIDDQMWGTYKVYRDFHIADERIKIKLMPTQ